MFKIGEFSQLGQVTVRTLHHYDELKLLQPAYIDPENDYRYYTVEQLPRLNRIVALKDLGLSLDQIARALDSDLSAAELRGMLELRQAELATQIADQQATLARVQARLRLIEREGDEPQYEVARKALPATVVASIREIVPHVSEMEVYRCSMFEELYAWLRRRNITPSGPEVVLYHNDEYVDHDIKMDLGVVVPASALGCCNGRVGITRLPAVPSAASVIHHGAVWDIPLAVAAIYIWTNANALAPAGPCREIHLAGPEEQQSQLTSTILEMQLPLRAPSDAAPTR